MYEIFKQLLQERGITVAEFSRQTGISKSTLSDWKNGRFQLKDSKRRIIADFFDVSLDYLDGLTDVRKPAASKPLHRAAAGEGCYNDTYTSEMISDAEEGYEYAVVVGESMLPVLMDGDVVKIKPATETTPHDYTLIKVDGEHATIKFVEVVENGVWLRASNKDVFEDKFFSIQEIMALPVTILGKVVELRRAL